MLNHSSLSSIGMGIFLMIFHLTMFTMLMLDHNNLTFIRRMLFKYIIVAQLVLHDFIYYSISRVTSRRSDYGHSALVTI